MSMDDPILPLMRAERFPERRANPGGGHLDPVLLMRFVCGGKTDLMRRRTGLSLCISSMRCSNTAADSGSYRNR
jgi:hypothetical protein